MEYNTSLFNELTERDEMETEGGAILPIWRSSGGTGIKLPWWIPIIIL